MSKIRYGVLKGYCGEGGDGGEGEEGGGGREGKMVTLLFSIGNTKKAKNRMVPDYRAQLASKIWSFHACCTHEKSKQQDRT